MDVFICLRDILYMKHNLIPALRAYLHQLQARSEEQSCSSNSGPGTPSSLEDTPSLVLWMWREREKREFFSFWVSLLHNIN